MKTLMVLAVFLMSSGAFAKDFAKDVGGSRVEDGDVMSASRTNVDGPGQNVDGPREGSGPREGGTGGGNETSKETSSCCGESGI